MADSEKYNVVTCQTNESYEKELSCLETLLSSQVDGIIMSLSRDTEDFIHIERLIDKKIPIVLFNRVAYTLNLSKVTVDDYHGARSVVEHLISIGRIRIAHITGPLNLQMARNRRKGYIDALSKERFPIDSDLMVEGDFTIENGITCCNKLLDLPKQPDAIFCVCDSMAFGAMMALKARQLKVPDDIAIAGFTNEHVAALVDPPLTTIDQPAYEIGANAAELLIKQIEDFDYHPEHRELKTNLIVRESTVGKKVLL
jgi:DNA-binding LacI/PurR family transcriptional regulator